jgi:hypothetical protein
MKHETLAELVARTVMEFERRELELQKTSQMQHQKRAKQRKSNVA